MTEYMRACVPGRSHSQTGLQSISSWLFNVRGGSTDLPPVGGVHGAVVSGVRRMNEVNARRARLVLGWVTVFGRVYRLGV